MKDTIFEELHYHSGLVAQGCWDELDVYDRAAVERFGDLVVKECIRQLQQEWYELNNDADFDEQLRTNGDIRFRAGKKSEIVVLIERIKKHFGVEL